MTATARTAISLRGFVKTYPSPAGPVHAVTGIDLDVARGQTLALLGPNGAGKSTTIDTLLGLLLVGLAPFVAMRVLIGHLLTPDSLGPALGGGLAFFGFLGGQWFPLPTHGFLHELGQLIPSYWLTRAARTGLGAQGWGLRGWTTVAVWFVAMAVLAGWAYRRDTQRVLGNHHYGSLSPANRFVRHTGPAPRHDLWPASAREQPFSHLRQLSGTTNPAL